MAKSIAKRNKFVQEKAFIVGVDIAKDHLDAYGWGRGQEMKTFRVANNYDGLIMMWSNIKVYQVRYGCDSIIIGFESTGDYHEPLKNFMRDKGVNLVQINPMHTKRVKNLNDNSPGSTDQKDPKIIVDIIRLEHYLSVITPVGPWAELRNLTHAREALLLDRTRCLNRLESLAFRIFPEFVQSFKSLSGKTVRYLLKKYPTPEQIAALPTEQLAGEIKKVSRGRFGPDLAQRLKQAAVTSLGTKEGRWALVDEIKYILEQLDRIDIKVDELEGKLAEELDKIPYAKKLRTIKGIGVVILGAIMGEVGDFRNYHKASEIIKLAGLDIFEISSGKYRGERHISKCGRWLLRKLLYFAALNLVRCPGDMKEYYQRLVGRGMVKIKALIAVSRKLIWTMFAMVRDGTEYINHYQDIKNSGKKEVTKIPA